MKLKLRDNSNDNNIVTTICVELCTGADSFFSVRGRGSGSEKNHNFDLDTYHLLTIKIRYNNTHSVTHTPPLGTPIQ